MVTCNEPTSPSPGGHAMEWAMQHRGSRAPPVPGSSRHITLNENGKIWQPLQHPSPPHEETSSPAMAWCPESRFRLSWLASSINTIRGSDIFSRLLLQQQPVKVTRCGLQWSLFPTKKKKMAVLPYCGYSYSFSPR